MEDRNGELLGFGSMTLAEGDAIVLVFDQNASPDTHPLTGFHTKQTVMEDRAAMFEKLWEDLEGRPVKVVVRRKE